MNNSKSTDHKKLTSRILRDVNDGIVAIDHSGTILFTNPRFYEILNIEGNVDGNKYASLMMNDSKNNDDFHQMLLQAIEEKETTQEGKVSYVRKDGTVIKLRVNSSFIYDEETKNSEGVTIEFSDITAEELYAAKYHDSAVSFIVLLAGVCVWVFLYGLWIYLGQPLHVNTMTNILLGISGIMFLVHHHFSSLTLKDVGLSTENLGRNLLVGVLVTIAGIGLLVIAKLILLKVNPSYFPADKPFFDFKRLTIWEFTYVISVVWQEFVARGVVHESLRRVIPGKYSEVMALVMSSLFFGAIHIHVGLHYMIGAAALLGVLGLLYIRQNSIWGTCIPHYILGVALVVLWLV
ncbi:MAG: PAS domain S-box protein [Erysipelotrichaceae bacterium]|nr:PAS domain S-box protein [Erysipelotrichaceae bacterium]